MFNGEGLVIFVGFLQSNNDDGQFRIDTGLLAVVVMRRIIYLLAVAGLII